MLGGVRVKIPASTDRVKYIKMRIFNRAKHVLAEPLHAILAHLSDVYRHLPLSFAFSPLDLNGKKLLENHTTTMQVPFNWDYVKSHMMLPTCEWCGHCDENFRFSKLLEQNNALDHPHAHLGHHVLTMNCDIWGSKLAANAAERGFSDCIDVAFDPGYQIRCITDDIESFLIPLGQKQIVTQDQIQTLLGICNYCLHSKFDQLVKTSNEAQHSMEMLNDAKSEISRQQSWLVNFGIDRTQMIHGFGCHLLAYALVMSRMEEACNGVKAFQTVNLSLSEAAKLFLHKLQEFYPCADASLIPEKAGYMFPLVKMQKKCTMRWIQASCNSIPKFVGEVVYLILTAVRTSMRKYCAHLADKLYEKSGFKHLVKFWYLAQTLEDVTINLPCTASHMGKGDMEKMHEHMKLFGTNSVMSSNLSMASLAYQFVCDTRNYGSKSQVMLCVHREYGKSYWAKRPRSDTHNNKLTELGWILIPFDSIENWFTLELNSAFVMIGNTLLNQMMGVAMGGKNSFLHSTNVEQMRAFTHVLLLTMCREYELAASYHFTWIVADDYLWIDCPEFDNMLGSFIPKGLNLKDEVVDCGFVCGHRTGIVANFLWMTLCVDEFGVLDYTMYSKADDKGIPDNRVSQFGPACNCAALFGAFSGFISRCEVASLSCDAFVVSVSNEALRLIIAKKFPKAALCTLVERATGKYKRERLITFDVDLAAIRVRNIVNWMVRCHKNRIVHRLYAPRPTNLLFLKGAKVRCIDWTRISKKFGYHIHDM